MKFSLTAGILALATSVAAFSASDMGLDLSLEFADRTCSNGQLKCCGVVDYTTKLTGLDLEWLKEILGSDIQVLADLDLSTVGVGMFDNCVDLPVVGDGSAIFEGGLLQTECKDTPACCHDTGAPGGVAGILAELLNTVEELEILSPTSS